MITEISTAIQVCANNCVHRGPRENTGLADVILAQRFEQQRPENGPEPVMGRDIEAFLAASHHRSRQAILHQLAQDELQAPAADLEVLRKPGREFDDSMIQERRPNFESVCHAHAVAIAEKLVVHEPRCLKEANLSRHANGAR